MSQHKHFLETLLERGEGTNLLLHEVTNPLNSLPICAKAAEGLCNIPSDYGITRSLRSRDQLQLKRLQMNYFILMYINKYKHAKVSENARV